MTHATILVVEDNPITRKMVRIALQSEGYTVLEAADGQGALSTMAQQVPDLILQDLLLPDMDGFELVKQLRHLPGGDAVPILAISGFLSQAELARTAQVGFTDYLFKPVEPSHLISTLQAYLPRLPVLPTRLGRGRRILVVDDDALQLKLLRIQLEQLGFEVATAGHGIEALERARALPPDAVVSDVLMPQLDGFRLCLAIRNDPQLARVPVLLTSAVYVEEADRQLGQAVGANAFLMRSPDHQEVAAALMACLEETGFPLPAAPHDLPMEAYTYRVIRQLEHQVSLGTTLTRRLALLETELGVLGRIVDTLRQSPVADTVLEEILYRCLDAAGISRGAAYLVDAEGGFTLRAQLGYPEATEDRLAAFDGYRQLLQEVMDGGEAVEISASGRWGHAAADLLSQSGSRSMLFTPLILGDERLGVLEIASANRELGEDWIAFVRIIGHQLGHAIKLARTLSQLSASEQRYRELFERNVAGIFCSAGNGRILDCNESFARILGYTSRDEVLALPADHCHVNPADRETLLARLREKPILHNHEVGMRGKDGHLVWTLANLSLLGEDEGDRSIQGTIIDITDRKREKEQDFKLRLAREIQMKLFPSSASGLAGLDIGGASFPAEATGGDYFDYVPMPSNCLGIAIGDVSGHGFGPALLMAETRAYLRTLALTRTDVVEIVSLLNRALAADMAGEHFITLLFAHLDPQTRALVYTSAGHPQGFILDASGAVKQVLDSTGLPLGIDADSEFAAGPPMTVAPGDLVLFLTDGIVEARAPDGALFGARRALDIVRLYRRDSANQIVYNLYHAVRSFSHNLPQDDDVTAVIVKVE